VRAAVIELPSGLAFGVSVPETDAEREAGVAPLGPKRAMFFDRGTARRPVSMLAVKWDLLLVWLRPMPDGRYLVTATERAIPGTFGYGVDRAPDCRLLEVPTSWPVRIAPGETLSVHERGPVRTSSRQRGAGA